MDFDNDGRRDLFVAQGHVLDTVSRARQGFDYLQPPLMLRNEDSSFVDVSASLGPAFARPAAGRGAAFADLDDDGDVDIVIANLDAEPTLLRNEGGNANHWLTVSLRGTRSNRQGIGADRECRRRARSRAVRDLLDRSSYQSASDGRVHFGLGGAKTVRRVEVRWPSGAVQVLKDDCGRPYPGDRRAVARGPAVRSWLALVSAPAESGSCVPIRYSFRSTAAG